MLLKGLPRVRIPIPVDRNRPTAIAIGGIVSKNLKKGDYSIIVVQRQPDGELSGAAVIELKIGS